MSWPIGYGNPGVKFNGDLSGTLFADGEQIGRPGGWVDLPPPEWQPGAAGELAIRVRAAVDAYGRPFLYGEQIELGGRTYGGMHSLAMSAGSRWVHHVANAFHALVERRVAETRQSRPAIGVTSPRRFEVDEHARRVIRPARPTLSGADGTTRVATSSAATSRDPRAANE
jgi:hypothetical protein